MALRCRAALADGKGDFLIDEVDIGDPGPDEIIVRMKAAGICHTDYDSLQVAINPRLPHLHNGISIARLQQAKDAAGHNLADP